MSLLKKISLDDFPSGPFRELLYFKGDIREIGRRLNMEPDERSNDLGDYLAIPLLLDEMYVLVAGLVPAHGQEFFVAADPALREKVREVVMRLLHDISYPENPEAIPSAWQD